MRFLQDNNLLLPKKEEDSIIMEEVLIENGFKKHKKAHPSRVSWRVFFSLSFHSISLSNFFCVGIFIITCIQILCYLFASLFRLLWGFIRNGNYNIFLLLTIHRYDTFIIHMCMNFYWSCLLHWNVNFIYFFESSSFKKRNYN